MGMVKRIFLRELAIWVLSFLAEQLLEILIRYWTIAKYCVI